MRRAGGPCCTCLVALRATKYLGRLESSLLCAVGQVSFKQLLVLQTFKGHLKSDSEFRSSKVVPLKIEVEWVHCKCYVDEHFILCQLPLHCWQTLWGPLFNAWVTPENTGPQPQVLTLLWSMCQKNCANQCHSLDLHFRPTKNDQVERTVQESIGDPDEGCVVVLMCGLLKWRTFVCTGISWLAIAF